MKRTRGEWSCAPFWTREFERWQFVFNPVFERALHGPGARRGWNFEPAALVRLKRETRTWG